MDGKQEILLDTSVLINFAAIGRIDLLAALSKITFLVTDHVRDEFKDHYADQYDAVYAAVAAGTLNELTVDSPEELADFAQLVAIRSLGDGECSAIVAAKHRFMVLAIDDRQAAKQARKWHGAIQLLATEDIVVSLIQERILTVAEADATKLEWETNHRFKLPFSSFREKLP